MQSPWHMLAASSGAPTPSIDGPGRNSPHLGSPFERLNLGGSWSGANLEQAALGGRRASLEPPPFSLGLTSSPGKSTSSNGLSSSYEAKSPLGGPPVYQDDRMSIDPQASNAATSKKPPLPPTLAMRRASLPKNHVNIHGQAIAKSSSPLASTPSPGPSARPQALAATDLRSVLVKSTTLVLDLRPPSSFHASHLPGSHSLPVPSTLLRRPAFTINKLTQMLDAPSMEAVSKWKEQTDIVLVDQDSSTAPEGSVLNGLAAKFSREGFPGHLWFVKGGHRAVQATCAGLLNVDASSAGHGDEVSSKSNGGLMAGGMGRSAFQQSA